jgi:hypothetical protein
MIKEGRRDKEEGRRSQENKSCLAEEEEEMKFRV